MFNIMSSPKYMTRIFCTNIHVNAMLFKNMNVASASKNTSLNLNFKNLNVRNFHVVCQKRHKEEHYIFKDRSNHPNFQLCKRNLSLAWLDELAVTQSGWFQSLSSSK